MASLVVQTSYLGDVVLTTPLLTRLAAREGAPVDVVTTPAGAALLGGHPAVARVVVYDKRAGGLLAFVRAARALRGATRAYLAQGSVRSAALALAAGARHRIGFDTSAGRSLYTARVAYRDDWHHARRLLALADPHAVDAPDDAIRPRLYPAGSDVAAVDALLAGRVRPIVALAPGSAWGTKRWPGFGALAERLVATHDVAIVGDTRDGAAGDEIRRRVPPSALVDATGRLSLLGSAELVRRAAALVTNDSAPQHLASAVGTPTVTVFGPTVPAFGFGPLAPGSRTVGLDALACRPCDRHGPAACPLGHWRCMRDLDAAAVGAVVRTLLQDAA